MYFMFFCKCRGSLILGCISDPLRSSLRSLEGSCFIKSPTKYLRQPLMNCYVLTTLYDCTKRCGVDYESAYGEATQFSRLSIIFKTGEVI